MAIISIPSSIGGVTIPGTATNGPLGILFNNPFTQDNLQYPRDLQSNARGHYVTFLIKDINPVGYQSDVEYTLGTGLLNAGINLENQITDKVQEITGKQPVQAAASTLEPETFTNRGSISLYIPETMNFSYGMGYNDNVSATAIGANALGAALNVVKKYIPESSGKVGQIGRAISSIVEKTASPDLIKLGLSKAGLAINPKLQILFEGIGFRSYQMTFTFTPYSEEEAKAVTNIVNTFKKYASPRIVKGNTLGMFFIPPAIFEPKFYFNGQENKKINAVNQSVITNIEVNHAPNGWATFNDGTPVQTTLSLAFKEISILDRDSLITGNY